MTRAEYETETLRLYAQWVQTNDNRLGERLRQRYEGLVVLTTRRWRWGYDHLWEDMLQEGWIGLFEGLRTYKTDGGAALTSWLIQKVFVAVAEYVRGNTGTIQVKEAYMRWYQKTHKVIRQMEAQTGCRPTPAQIAAAMQMTEDDYTAKLAHGRRVLRTLSYEGLQAEESRPSAGPGYSEGRGRISPIDLVSPDFAPQVALRVGVGQALEHLDARDQAIVRRYHYDGKKGREIAVEQGLGETRIWQLMERSYKCLRPYLDEPGVLPKAA